MFKEITVIYIYIYIFDINKIYLHDATIKIKIICYVTNKNKSYKKNLS